MLTPNSPERGSESEDIDTCSEEAMASAELVLDETSLCEVEETHLEQIQQELTPEGCSQLE